MKLGKSLILLIPLLALGACHREESSSETTDSSSAVPSHASETGIPASPETGAQTSQTQNSDQTPGAGSSPRSSQPNAAAPAAGGSSGSSTPGNRPHGKTRDTGVASANGENTAQASGKTLGSKATSPNQTGGGFGSAGGTPQDPSTSNAPLATALDGRPGIVISPSSGKLIDVSGLTPGAVTKDPTDGTTFKIPQMEMPQPYQESEDDGQ